MFNRGPVKGLSIKIVWKILTNAGDGEFLQNDNLNIFFYGSVKLGGNNTNIFITFSTKKMAL